MRPDTELGGAVIAFDNGGVRRMAVGPERRRQSQVYAINKHGQPALGRPCALLATVDLNTCV